MRQLLAELPDAPPRSKLEPHVDLIRQLRRKRFTYREIAEFLKVHLGMSIHWTTIHAFLKVRARHRCDVLRPKYEMPPPEPAETTAPPALTAADIRARIEALKQRARQPKPETKPIFEYEEGKPLTLIPRPEGGERT